MKKEEYLLQNQPFYHVTPTKNIEGILKDGLENRNGKGICVVRTNNQEVIKYIVETMLIGEGDREFSIIEILPDEHKLTVEEIKDDGVAEVTNPVHNYIHRDKLVISEENNISTYTHPALGYLDLTPLIKAIKEEIDLKSLE